MQKYIVIPDEVKLIFDIYKEYDLIAYLVGGCVRDSLIEREVHDWDICTSVKPEETIKIFRQKGYQVVETGLKHGTVTVIINGNHYEITTFRRDGVYSDGRHPDYVDFTTSLIEDLSRRDFTMNAIAYNPNEGIIDPFNGVKDIRDGIIRCVGSPSERFSEDPLRIMRCMRFAAQLGFKTEFVTKINAIDLSSKLKYISEERKRDELCKMLMSASNYLRESLHTHRWILYRVIPELNRCRAVKQQNPYHIYDVYWHIAVSVCDAPEDLIIRLAMLFHDIGKPYTKTYDRVHDVCHFLGHAEHGAKMTDEIMRRLKFDNNTRESVVELVKYHDVIIPPKKTSVKRWLNRIGEEQFRRLFEVKTADIKAQNPAFINRLQVIEKVKEIFEEVLSEKECFSLKDLAVNGHDLISIGFKPGKDLGAALDRLLLMVMQEAIPNEKEFLLDNAKDILEGKEWR